MPIHGLHAQRRKFDETFKIGHYNARSRAEEMRSKADDDPTRDTLEAAKAADDALAALCRKFRNWSLLMRHEISRILDDPTQEFAEGERDGWQALHKDIVAHLSSLEAECPASADPPAAPPNDPPARRTFNV